MVRYQNDEAITMARRAQAIAGPLGLAEVQSDTLNTEACALHTIGADWTATMRSALDIALSGRRDVQAGRAYVNFHAMYGLATPHRIGPRLARHRGPALPASARARLGGRGPPVGGPGLPLRGRWPC
jgi:hypothetical protein